MIGWSARPDPVAIGRPLRLREAPAGAQRRTPLCHRDRRPPQSRHQSNRAVRRGTVRGCIDAAAGRSDRLGGAVSRRARRFGRNRRRRTATVGRSVGLVESHLPADQGPVRQLRVGEFEERPPDRLAVTGEGGKPQRRAIKPRGAHRRANSSRPARRARSSSDSNKSTATTGRVATSAPRRNGQSRSSTTRSSRLNRSVRSSIASSLRISSRSPRRRYASNGQEPTRPRSCSGEALAAVRTMPGRAAKRETADGCV